MKKEAELAKLGRGRPKKLLLCPHCHGMFATGEFLTHVPHCRSNPARKDSLPRKQALVQFLRENGPIDRGDIIAKSGMPRGTISHCLNDKATFRQRPDKKYEAIPDRKRRKKA